MHEARYMIFKHMQWVPAARGVLTAASNWAAERKQQKTVQTAGPSPGKRSSNKQVLLRMEPSYVTRLASTITGFFPKKHRFTYIKVALLLLPWGFPTNHVFLQVGRGPSGVGHVWKLWTCAGVPKRGTSELKQFHSCHTLKNQVQWLTCQAFNVRRNWGNTEMSVASMSFLSITYY